jgi:hypothetical protein
MGAGASASLGSSSDAELVNMVAEEYAKDPARLDRIYAEAKRVAQGRGDTGESADSMAQSVFDEINKVRSDPAAYVAVLAPLIALFKDKVFERPGRVPMTTHEGAAAVHECIDFLQDQPAVPALTGLFEGLSKSAADHAADLGASGEVAHNGSDGSTPGLRMNRYGEWKETCGENISFGCPDATAIVCQLLVDDGVEGRGHRLNLFKAEFRAAGIAVAKHKTWDVCCVMELAGGFGPKLEKLAVATKVEATGEVTPEVQAVLNSIPWDNMKDAVTDALKAGHKVTLDYKPAPGGKVTVVIDNGTSSSTMEGGFG